MDWETGIEFGRAIERLASHDLRITKLEEEISRARGWAARAGLVLLIWAVGLSIKLPAENIGEFTQNFLKGLVK